METVSLVARSVPDRPIEHAKCEPVAAPPAIWRAVERELTSLRAQRANFVFRGTTELAGAFKLSATNEFTWLPVNRMPSDVRIVEAREKSQRWRVERLKQMLAQFGNASRGLNATLLGRKFRVAGMRHLHDGNVA